MKDCDHSDYIKDLEKRIIESMNILRRAELKSSGGMSRIYHDDIVGLYIALKIINKDVPPIPSLLES